MNPRDTQLPTRIRTLRIRNGITVKQAAQSAGVSETSWYAYERGDDASVPGKTALLTRGAAIAHALGEPVAALFTDDPVFEIVLSAATIEQIRNEGRDAAVAAATRLAAQLEPAFYAAATRGPVDVAPGARAARPRRSRAQMLAGIGQARTTRGRRERRVAEPSLVAAA